MNYFDRFLETQLRLMLDPVVATQPPARGRRRKAAELVLTVVPSEPASPVEAVPVPIAVTPLAHL